ncbi:putative zinc-type alcohol dehydrogenase-like protein YogA [Lasiodiplodia theobromae]|uniref:Putative zinc-type alcohol dehydrogenase-like protein YogA n=1 Tax=Lasiodiplodia theobromae TaxID=45133 RepID=A0A5N5D863_9PEZI|nr:putative zinc-type alcohol dehydrogenase-like protein YogA [Lasiodiplodia theobromae]
MTAAVLTSPGAHPPTSCFTHDPLYPRPSLPSPDWILVRVHAAGLNRAELRGRAGHTPFLPEFNIFQSEYHADPPAILGEEFVGEVAEAGATTGFEPGEKVAGFIYGGGKAYDGAYAQYTVVHRRRCFRLPRETGLGWEVLGAMPMSLWTAYGSVVLCGRLRERGEGATVLVHGATSSVGIFAILLAKERGATVVATTRQEGKLARLKEVGADYAVLEEDIEKEVLGRFPRGVDIVLELVGPDQIQRGMGLLARYGTLVVTGILNLEWEATGFNPMKIPATRCLTKHAMTNAGPGTEDDELDLVEPVLAEAIRNVESGKWPKEYIIDRTFELREAGAAHTYMEDNKAKGKVVMTIP